MTKEEIFEKILEWEGEVEESFVDYFDSYMYAVSFMFWCRGKGYVTVESFNEWEEKFKNNDIFADDANDYVFNYGLPEHENWQESYKILAEFISESAIYTQRLKEFLVSDDY